MRDGMLTNIMPEAVFLLDEIYFQFQNSLTNKSMGLDKEEEAKDEQ